MKATRVKILASFDDGGALDLEIAALMTKYDIPTTFYIPVLWRKVNALKQRHSINENQLRVISDLHQIGGHTISHPMLTSLKNEDAQYEIAEGKIQLEELIGKEVTSFCYPRGRYNDTIKLMVEAAGFKDARTTKVGWIHQPEDPFETHTTVHVGYDRDEYDGKTWLNYAIEKYWEAKVSGDYYHIWGHGFEMEQGGNLGKLELLLKEITE